MNVARITAVLTALFILLVTAPALALAGIAIWLQDFRSPLYIPERVGLNGQKFRMFKLRSMVAGADRSQVDSTSADDPRLTPVGRLVRKFKLDELPQFLNVIGGDMNMVGPRPNVARETALYSDLEARLLSVKPGITDFSSIVFADLAQILHAAPDANVAYNQLVRPWKSRLALFYIDHASPWLDLKLIFLTVVAVFSNRRARDGVVRLLRGLDAPAELQAVAARRVPLEPTPPPGLDEIVMARTVCR